MMKTPLAIALAAAMAGLTSCASTGAPAASAPDTAPPRAGTVPPRTSTVPTAVTPEAIVAECDQGGPDPLPDSRA